MDASFWLARWRANDIGFNLPKPHPALVEAWGEIGAAPGTQVLVPLAGKSVDMVWLAEQGHDVLGIELSGTAVADFFQERSRRPSTTEEHGYRVSRAGPYELWCGDIFEFPTEATRRIGAVYDRAALVAMPYVMQADYVRKLAELTPAGVPMLLVSLTYDPSEMAGPPFSVGPDRIASLANGLFTVAKLGARDGLAASPRLREKGLTHLTETTYLLKRTSRMPERVTNRLPEPPSHRHG
ncbi:MAG: thiopurine S-methyltransferase [Hyphomicrobium sp.]|nr:thiopurine S-methyltransferase [Hyphomicrobium sp.]